MIIDEYDIADQEAIRQICQELFHKNYITEYVFDSNESLKKANPSYSFVMSHFDAVEELLDRCGWKLCNDEHTGVLHLTSEYPSAKVNFSLPDSYTLLALRLLYDDGKIRASATGEVFITVRDIVEKLTMLGAVDKVTKQDREKALRLLASKNIIAKLTGKLGEMDMRLAILPSVVCAISPEKIKNFLKAISVSKLDAEEQEDTEA